MSLSPHTQDSGVVPNAGEFGVAWIVYALFGFGIFLWWPALFAVLVCHLRAGSPAVGFLASHYRWLARTFWLSLAGYVLAVGIILGGAWPLRSSDQVGAGSGAENLNTIRNSPSFS